MTDSEILDILHKGDSRRAFDEIVKSHSERLYLHVRSLVGNHEDADDLLQDIFIKIWAALPSFRGEAQLFTWVWRIATNETLNWLRKQRVRNLFAGDDVSAYASSIADDDARLDADRAERLMSEAILRLPPKQRSVFVMRYYDEMKYEDMSEVTGTSVSALKASYHFAYEKVKDYILKKMEDFD